MRSARDGYLASAAAALLLAAPARLAARDIPALTGPVVDEAGLLDQRDRRRLEALSRAAWQQPAEHRAQLQYLLARSLGGDDIEGFAARVFEAWKLGEKGKDNGVLVVVAREDRKIRIETGYGNEGALTDAQAGQIIRSTIAPAFREGRYGDGLYLAGVQILSALGALPQEMGPRQAARPQPIHGLGTLAVAALLMVALLARVLTGFGPRRRRFWGGGWGGTWGGGWGGGGGLGGWGGGSLGGGGGWSGGGGRSGGGGASGSW
jgi:uncharacterized protein